MCLPWKARAPGAKDGPSPVSRAAAGAKCRDSQNFEDPEEMRAGRRRLIGTRTLVRGWSPGTGRSRLDGRPETRELAVGVVRHELARVPHEPVAREEARVALLREAVADEG